MTDITLDELKEKKGLMNTIADGLGKIGIKKENVIGSDDNKKMIEQAEEGREVLSEWNSTDSLYQELYSKNVTYRSFYKGDDAEQGVAALEGDVRIKVNMGATIIDLFTYILTNNAPEVQFFGDPDPVSQIEAAFKETMTARLLSDAAWPKRFRDGGKNCFMVGYTYIYPFWNKTSPLGGKKGTFDISVLNPFTTRVKFKQSDFEKPESFITWFRMSPAEVLKQYDFEALPDSLDPNYPKSLLMEEDGMVTVFRRYGDEDIKTVINSRCVDTVTHNLGFCPLVPINNIQMLNDVHGHSEIERWIGLAQEINALISGISEVARDLAYPTIMEYNNALGGVKPQKWRGMLVPAKRSDRGESVELLTNSAQIAPMIQQVKLLIELLHFVSLMPAAAGGIFPANVTSGFQAKLSMQSATLTTDDRKIDWEWALKQIVKMAFKLLEKNDPEALSIKTESKTVKITDVYDHEMKVVWPENLPIDIAREIQNLVLGIQTGMTSLHQAIDRYNVLMGMGTSEETVDYLKQEVDDPALSPDRSLKVNEVRAKIKDILQGLSDMNAQIDAKRAAMGGGATPDNMNTPGNGTVNNNPEMNTANMAMQTGNPAEKKTYPPTAREAIVPESTGGQVIPPVAGGQ